MLMLVGKFQTWPQVLVSSTRYARGAERAFA